MGNCPCSSIPDHDADRINLEEKQEFTQEVLKHVGDLRTKHIQQILQIKTHREEKGQLFRGNFLAGKKFGYGEYFSDKNAYFGMFDNDLPNGEGILIKDGKNYIKSIFTDGKADGPTTEQINSTTFTGHYKNGRKSHGTLKTEQYTYLGQFNNNNNFHGTGTLTFQNGDIYEGQFENGVYHGKGSFVTKDQGKYLGEFRNGLYEGKGTFQWRDSFFYEGDYRSGERNGFGRFVKEHAVYEGEWVNGQPKSKSKNKFPGERKPLENLLSNAHA